MNKKISLLIVFFCTNVLAQVDVEALCYTSSGNKPIRFEMRTYYDPTSKWNGGFVKYEKSKTLISISQVAFQTEAIDKDQPSEATVSWVEITKGQISGHYERVSQGTNVSSLTYVRNSDKKKYAFLYDANTNWSLEKGCEWKLSNKRRWQIV